jgi:SAM-dependent methyltransferase
MTDGTGESRWGALAIDPRGRDLPALKVKYLLDHLPNGRSVLEIGSGNGKLLRSMHAQRPELALYGCDVRLPDVPPDVYEFRLIEGALPYAPSTFDTVLLFDVLEHVPDPRKTLAEAADVLVAGGTLLAFVPIEGEFLSAYTVFRALLGADTYVETKEHVQSFTHRALRSLVEERFELRDVRYAYHVLGQWMDAGFFAATRLRRLRRFWWNENTYYRPSESAEPSSTGAGVLNALLRAGNAVAWAESTLLSEVRMGSAGVLFAARKR